MTKELRRSFFTFGITSVCFIWFTKVLLKRTLLVDAVCDAVCEVQFTCTILDKETGCCRTSLLETHIYLFSFRSKVWFWLRDANDVGGAGSETLRQNKDSSISASNRLPLKRGPFLVCCWVQTSLELQKQEAFHCKDFWRCDRLGEMPVSQNINSIKPQLDLFCWWTKASEDSVSSANTALLFTLWLSSDRRSIQFICFNECRFCNTENTTAHRRRAGAQQKKKKVPLCAACLLLRVRQDVKSMKIT